MIRRWLLTVLLFSSATLALAQNTQQQTFELRPGWNAIHLEVEPDDRAIDAVFSAANCSSSPAEPPVASVWTYDARFGRVGTIPDPAQGLLNATGWFGWFPDSRPESVLSNLFALQIHRAYLVKLDGTVAVTCNVTGVPRYTRQTWTPDSFNLVGFPVEPPPRSATFDTWFAPSPAHDGQAIFRLDPSGQWQSVQPAFETINPGEAYWVYTRGGSSYQGPLEIELNGTDRLEFDAGLTRSTLVFRNRLDIGTNLTLRRLTSTTPVDLTFQQLDTTWPTLPASHVLPVAAGDELVLTLAPDRSAFSGRAEHILEITNGLGSRLLLAVGANATAAADRTGLWVGSVRIQAVGALRCTAMQQETCGATTEPVPVEVPSLQVTNNGGTTVSWDEGDPGLRYDVAGGTLGQLAAEGDVSSASCLAADLSPGPWLDPRADPAVGEGEYYLVRSRNSAFVSTYGSSSVGGERIPAAACDGLTASCEATQAFIGLCQGGTNDGLACNPDLGSEDCPGGGVCLYCNPADATPTPVGEEFAMPLLVHVDDGGQARLLKEVIQMFDPPCRIQDPANPGYETLDPARPGIYVLLTDEDKIPSFEGVSLRDGVPVGARISTAAYDFDGTSGADWDATARAMQMTGAFGGGATLTVGITLPPDFATNPFRHQFHPDHDNLPVAEAPQIGRQIELTFEGSYGTLDLDGGQIQQGPEWGSDEVGGYYTEILTGLHRQPIEVEGKFLLRRAVQTPVLNPDPQTCTP